MTSPGLADVPNEGRWWRRSTHVGPRTLAVTRLAWGTSMALVLWASRHVPAQLAGQPAEAWQPVGLARLVPVGLPEAVVEGVLLVGVASCVLVILGGWSRASAATCQASTLLVVSLGWSYSDFWSHGSSATLLVGCVLWIAPLGAAWSLDARRGRAAPIDPWLARLAIWSARTLLALFLLNAFWWKWRRAGLAWADAENLRNILAIRYGTFGDTAPRFVELLMGQPLALGLLGAGNLVAQALPALALPWLRRRPAQIVASLAWFAETVGLTFVMSLFHGQMIPLALLFVSWDAAPLESAPGRATGRGLVWRRVATAGVVVILFAQVVTAWTLRDVRDRLYPLTASPMYSVRYEPERTAVVYDTVPELPAEARRRLLHEYSGVLRLPRDAERLETRFARIVAEARSRHGVDLQSITAWLVTWDLRGPEPRVASREPLGSWPAVQGP